LRKKKPEIFLTGLLLKTKLSSLAGLPHQRDYDMRVVVTGLTKSEAMVAEQVLISAYTLKYLDNARREIAAKNVDNYLQYTAAVAELLACGAEETLIGLMRE